MSGPAIADSFVVARPRGCRVRTRLRPGEAEADALREIGTHLGGLRLADLTDRLARGRIGGDAERARRKKALTPQCSSRWAGSITRANNDQYGLGMRGLTAYIDSLEQATATISKRLAVPVGTVEGTGKKRVRGYATAHEWFVKSRRLTGLGQRLETAQGQFSDGRPGVTVGGNRLWRKRNSLDEAGLTEAQWQQAWQCSRWFLTADGDAGQSYGNGLIKVMSQADGTGIVRVTVPEPLRARLGRFLTLAAPVSLDVHRGTEWADRVRAGRAIRYDISFDPAKGRWYLDASWTHPVEEYAPTVQQLSAGHVLGVDLNADHLAAHVVDASGNPVGEPVTIPLNLTGLPASTRDARLREAISILLRIVRERGCAAVSIENLNFADARATGRDTLGRGKRGKRFRRTIASIPTAQFRDRIAAMAAAAGIWIIAVDPRNTSKHGAKFWKPELARRRYDRPASGHHAAAAMIARRALGLRITRTRHSPGRDSGHDRASVTGAPQASARPAELPQPAAHPVTGTGFVLADTG